MLLIVFLCFSCDLHIIHVDNEAQEVVFCTDPPAASELVRAPTRRQGLWALLEEVRRVFSTFLAGKQGEWPVFHEDAYVLQAFCRSSSRFQGLSSRPSSVRKLWNVLFSTRGGLERELRVRE